MFKKDGFFGDCVNIGSGFSGGIAITAEVVGPTGIDADKKDMANIFG
jgi:hypothetical protein